MRLIVTADLHFNHKRSRPLAIDLIERINQRSGDVLLLIGDTAAADGDDLEQALSSIRFPGPKLFVAGNHELWTNGPDSHHLFQESLPARVRALGCDSGQGFFFAPPLPIADATRLLEMNPTW